MGWKNKSKLSGRASTYLYGYIAYIPIHYARLVYRMPVYEEGVSEVF